jgi:hypothetical protein
MSLHNVSTYLQDYTMSKTGGVECDKHLIYGCYCALLAIRPHTKCLLLCETAVKCALQYTACGTVGTQHTGLLNLTVAKLARGVFSLFTKAIFWDSPLVTICTTRYNIQQFYFLPTQCIYVFCVDLRTNSDFPLHKIYLFFLTEMKSVYCAVRTVSLNETDYASSLKG